MIAAAEQRVAFDHNDSQTVVGESDRASQAREPTTDNDHIDHSELLVNDERRYRMVLSCIKTGSSFHHGSRSDTNIIQYAICSSGSGGLGHRHLLCVKCI